jgi:hypothetical protein
MSFHYLYKYNQDYYYYYYSLLTHPSAISTLCIKVSFYIDYFFVIGLRSELRVTLFNSIELSNSNVFYLTCEIEDDVDLF